MKVLGIIPARGGSKGVSKKNIRLVNNKPLIEYSIKSAENSKYLADFLVATDSDEILNVVKKNNCNFFKRGKQTAEDSSPIELVIHEVLNNLKKEYDVIILLQPTAPARSGNDIDKVIEMFLEDKALECVVSVVELNDIHPARMYNIVDDNLKPLQKENEKKRRQDLDPVYLRNGAIYAIKTASFLLNNKLIIDNKKPFVMPESKWINIDTERDLIVADALLRSQNN